MNKKGLLADSIMRVEIWENNEGRTHSEMAVDGVVTHMVLMLDEIGDVLLWGTVSRDSPKLPDSMVDFVEFPNTILRLRIEKPVPFSQTRLESIKSVFVRREDLEPYAISAHNQLHSLCGYAEYISYFNRSNMSLIDFLEMGDYELPKRNQEPSACVKIQSPSELQELFSAGYGDW